MLSFLVRRLLQGFAVMVFVSFIAFLSFRYIGDPVQQLVGQDTSLEDRQKLRESLGLDKSIFVQYKKFFVSAVQLKFPNSYQHREPVTSVLWRKFPATFELALFSTLLALLIGVPMGVYAGLHPKSLLSNFFMIFSLIGVSLPTFVIGIVLIDVFSTLLHWFPSFGRKGVVDLGGWETSFLTLDGWRSILLPAITLGFYQMTLLMRLVRSEVMETLRADFIKFGRARGLKERTLSYGHALRNSFVPVLTIAGLQLGAVVAFAIITEEVFSWPGMGREFLYAVHSADTPYIGVYLLFVALIFIVVNLVVDLLYHLIDPRLRVRS